MFDTTTPNLNSLNTFTWNNALDSSSAISLTPYSTCASNPFTTELDSPNGIALSSSFDSNFSLNSPQEELVAASSEVFGNAATDLSFFNQSQTLTSLTSISTDTTNFKTDALSAQTSSDSLTGIPEGSSLVGSFNHIGWLRQNIQDVSLRWEVRSLSADGELDRNDMITICQNVEDGGVINAREVKDLQKIVSNASLFNMPDYVSVLSNKIVNGDVANTTYQGNSLGNLYAGSSATQMEDLIGKWFLGNDRPDADGYTYQYANGSLFQNGISYQDVNQGSIGDCYFLASLAATASGSPSTIKSMFVDNGDDTYTVRFYNNGVADYVTVDRYLPTNSLGNFVEANQGDYYNNSSNELWVALAEKAYAQLNESGWIHQDGTNSYQGIEGGWGYYALPQITARSAKLNILDSSDFNSIVSAFNTDSLITFASKNNLNQVASNIVPNHLYTLVDYNSSTETFTLFNPWGIGNHTYSGSNRPGLVELSFDQLRTSFSDWEYTTT